MVAKKKIQPQDDQDAESFEYDELDQLLEDACKRYRLYRDFHDSFKLTTPWPLHGIGYELPPSPERPLVVTSFKQLYNYGKERGACDVCNPGPSPERPLVVTSFEQLYNYGKERGDARP